MPASSFARRAPGCRYLCPSGPPNPDISRGPGGYIENDLIWISFSFDAVRFSRSRLVTPYRHSQMAAGKATDERQPEAQPRLLINSLGWVMDGPPNHDDLPKSPWLVFLGKITLLPRNS
ncbi:MAG: hypothetical protein KQJ78_06810 [Deltaproteobacteria bacterium]|nr:hypothetical protein [Deltaproteobacteria bacterium]